MKPKLGFDVAPVYNLKEFAETNPAEPYAVFWVYEKIDAAPSPGVITTKRAISNFLEIGAISSRKGQRALQDFANSRNLSLVILLNQVGAAIVQPHSKPSRAFNETATRDLQNKKYSSTELRILADAITNQNCTRTSLRQAVSRSLAALE